MQPNEVKINTMTQILNKTFANKPNYMLTTKVRIYLAHNVFPHVWGVVSPNIKS